MPPNNQAPNQAPMPTVPAGQFAQAPAQPGPVGSGPAAPAAPQQPTNPNSTQSSLQFAEIRDGMIIMTDGSFRSVVACQSINFDLMSSREREGVEYSYQNFLNSLHHPVQILVRSQRVDIAPYIEKLATLRRDEDNMLLSVLMDDYINFIDILSQEANIMDKSFYVIVPFFPEGDFENLKSQAKGFFGKLFAQPNQVKTINAQTYEKAQTEINNRTEGVISGLFAMGVHGVRLNTTELSELLYNYYNPDTAIREPVRDFAQMTSIYTRKAAAEQPTVNQAPAPYTPAPQPEQAIPQEQTSITAQPVMSILSNEVTIDHSGGQNG